MKKFHTTTHKFLTDKQSARFSIVFLIGLLAFGILTLTNTESVNSKNGVTTPQVLQNTITGEWTAELNRSKPGEVQMTFHRRSDKGGFNMSGDSISLSELQSLTAEAISSARSNVSFNIVREAGTFACEGFFKEGRGAGFWTFTQNPNFVSAMRGRGYTNLTDEELLRAAMYNLTTKFIEDLKSVGYERLEFKQLLRASSHDITPVFVREMQSAGYQGLTIEELARARNQDINVAYIKEVQAMGFDKQPLEKVIRLRNHEITQAFINRMRSAGFDNLSIEQLIRLKNQDMTPEFVSGLKAEGYSNIPAETAIRLKQHDVDRDFIRRVKARGFNNLTLDELIRFRRNGIIK